MSKKNDPYKTSIERIDDEIRKVSRKLEWNNKIRTVLHLERLEEEHAELFKRLLELEEIRSEYHLKDIEREIC